VGFIHMLGSRTLATAVRIVPALSPFHSAEPCDSSNITNNVLGYGPSPLRRHKSSWAEHSAEFWSNRTKETRHTKDCGRVVTPTDDLGRNKT
jgi:hypothetical protein